MPLKKRFWYVLLMSMLAYGHAFSQELPKAQELPNLSNWCSADAEFSTAKLNDKLMLGKDLAIPREEGKWFSFVATTSTIDVRVSSGGDKGSLSFAYIFLMDEKVQPVQHQKYSDSDGNLALLNQELTIGKRYYLGIACNNSGKNSSYSGSFSLCVSNEATNDFPQGAVELTNLANWRSETDQYTTVGATGIGTKPSKMKDGPNYNRWFKFTARASKIDVKLLFDKKKGGVKFPFLTLWDANLRQLQCEQDLYADGELPLNYTRLKVGATYYLSVDHNYNSKYLGTFGIAIDDGLPSDDEDKETVLVIGRLQSMTGKGIRQSKVVLLNEKSEVVETQTTDVLGKFSFRKLSPDKHFMVQIEEQDVEFHFDVFQTENDGTILQKGKEIKKNLYGFQKLPSRLGFLPLLRWVDLEKLAHKNGDFGIVGRLVNPKSPIDGLAKRKVYLYKDRKSIVDSTETDPFGKFWFHRANPTGKNLIAIGGELKGVYAEMLLVNDKYLPVMVSTSKNVDELGFFHFKSLPPIDVTMERMEENDELSDSPDFERLVAGKTIELREVYFEPNEAQLLPDSYAELDRLVTALKSNEKLKIALHGHTDNTGTETENLLLSKDRAKAVYDYLLKQGVASGRLSFKGHGSAQPVAENETAEGRKANRRVEFKVLP